MRAEPALVREHVAAVLHEECVVVPLVGILRVVLSACRRSIGEVLFGVDRAHRTDIGLVARSAGRAFLEVHVQETGAEDCDGTFDYLVSLEWITARENLCLVGPAGTGKSHLLVALGHAAIDAGHRVRYFTAAELVETLYRGLADNSVGRVIETILKADLILIDEIGFAPLDHNAAQLLFRLVAAAYERRSLGIGSHWPFQDWGRFLPEHTTAVSLLDRLLHHAVLVATEGESYRMRQARTNGGRTARSST